MKLHIAITTALVAPTTSASADPSKIGTQDAKGYYGREMMVTGTVANQYTFQIVCRAPRLREPVR